jgi:hypothetical protein
LPILWNRVGLAITIHKEEWNQIWLEVSSGGGVRSFAKFIQIKNLNKNYGESPSSVLCWLYEGNSERWVRTKLRQNTQNEFFWNTNYGGSPSSVLGFCGVKNSKRRSQDEFSPEYIKYIF